METDEIRSLVDSHAVWYHRIEVAPGITTPGTHQSQAMLEDLDHLGLPADCRGLRALDLGARDGFFAFALERRGAEVVALDYLAPTATGFHVASRILGSTVPFLVENVYDLDRARIGDYDLVLFLGLLYHLRDPMRAIDRVRDVTRTGGRVFVETQLALEPDLARSAVPAWQYFPGASLAGDATNKWAPNPAGLRAVFEDCLFEVQVATTRGSRGYLVATAVEDPRRRYFRELDRGRGAGG